MPILNYSTTIEAVKTVGEIQSILAKNGDSRIVTEYEGDMVIALSFMVPTKSGNISFRLPVRPDATLNIMRQSRCPRRLCNKPQAIRVSWRIVKDWVEAQMALIQTQQAMMEEVFLPYALSKDGSTTLFQSLSAGGFLMLAKGGQSIQDKGIQA